MDEITLVIDILLDETDYHRLESSNQNFLYLARESQSLYSKHINHLDYHHPNLGISYGRDTHQIINLDTRKRRDFLIDHKDLDKTFSVAVGITNHLAMIALGDLLHTRLQIVDVHQPLKIHLKENYSEGTDANVPLPRYFTGNPNEAELVFSDNSKLPIDLNTPKIGTRKPSKVNKMILEGTVLSSYLSILGPFILLHIRKSMSEEDLQDLRLMVELAKASRWVAIDKQTLVYRDNIPPSSYQDIIEERDAQLSKIGQIIDKFETEV